MINILKIDKDHPVLDKYKEQKNYSDKLIILESRKVIEYAMIKGFKFQEIIADSDFFSRNPNISSDSCYLIDKTQLSNALGFKKYNSAFALIQKPNLRHKNSTRILILDGLTSPENIGSITRSACAFGFKKIYYHSRGVSPYLKRCVRVSTGHVLTLDIIKSFNIENLIIDYKKSGFKFFACHKTDNSISLQDIDKNYKKIGLVVGSEGHGIRSSVSEICDQSVAINTHQDVNHLNVSNASSILMHYFMSI